MRHAPGKPVWVAAEGLNFTGQEHRFYDAPARYTGLIWPATPEGVENALTRLRFMSLAAFKCEAERRGFFIEMKDLPPPHAGDTRPLPVPLAR